MTFKKINYSLFALATAIILIMSVSCKRDIDVLEPATYPKTPEVFIDGFSAGLNYAAFGGSKVTAFDVDTEVKYSGTSSMKISVPDFEDPQGAYAGGAYFTSAGRDLSGYDALTFWAKASQPASIDIVGIGNDLAEAKYVASRSGLDVNSNWKKYIIPIPDPSKMVAERGMFFYSEGPENNRGYTIWFDEVKFEKLGTIAHPKPAILETQDQTTDAAIGDVLNIGGFFVTFNSPDGVDIRVDAAAGYYTFSSSNESVATVNEQGQISAVGLGAATITAKLGSVDAVGSITVNVGEAPPGPAGPAPTPTLPANDVISLFSNAYTNVPIDTWATGWEFSTAVLKDIQISGDDVKLYTNLNFNGIEFASQTIDASEMNGFHMDIWTPDPTAAPASFKVLLVDFGANGVFDGGDDVSHEITFNAANTPGFASESWISLDVPLSSFAGLITKAHLAQLVISGDPNTVYVDNVYLYKGAGNTTPEPTTPAPTPTEPANEVISLFSNAYTDVTVDSWATGWEFSTAVLEDIQISGDDVKKYTNLNFNGIEFVTQTVDATTMNRFHMDIWTPDPTAAPAEFKVLLVDFGANGVFDGGDDVSHELVFTATSNPSIASETWVSLDVPLSAFTGLTTRANLAQMVISGDPNTVYVDNVYFYIGGGGTPTEPTVAAPTPTVPSENVTSLFSNAYTDVPVDTWLTGWSSAVLSDIQIQGNDTKLYTDLDFAGIETVANPIDATDMDFFHIDVWSPNAAPFRVKLVDLGAGVEGEIAFNIAQEEWVSLDIPLDNFADPALVTDPSKLLTVRSSLQQLIISGLPAGAVTAYVDNIYFYK